jgi:hypothetical protein
MISTCKAGKHPDSKEEANLTILKNLVAKKHKERL